MIIPQHDTDAENDCAPVRLTPQEVEQFRRRVNRHDIAVAVLAVVAVIVILICLWRAGK